MCGHIYCTVTYARVPSTGAVLHMLFSLRAPHAPLVTLLLLRAEAGVAVSVARPPQVIWAIHGIRVIRLNGSLEAHCWHHHY